MRKLSLVLFCLVLVVAAGCKVKPPAKVTIPGVGTVSSGSAVDLSALPAALRYPGATAVGSWSANTPDGQGTSYNFETADPLDRVVAFYKAAMPAWKTTATMQSQEGTMLTASSPDEKEGMVVMVSAKDGKTTVVITYVKKN